MAKAAHFRKDVKDALRGAGFPATWARQLAAKHIRVNVADDKMFQADTPLSYAAKRLNEITRIVQRIEPESFVVIEYVKEKPAEFATQAELFDQGEKDLT